DKEFPQYAINFTVTDKQLNDGDFEFYITDGDAVYKNGTRYIAISRAGEYRLLFSDEHFYGNGRRYRYVLSDDKKDYTEIEIGTAEEFIDFAKKCTASADYSKDKAVYITKDIDFAGVNFVGAGEFSGKFYGGYHTFKNVTLSADQPSIFNIVKRDGLVERLNIEITCTDKKAEYVAAVGRNFGTVSGVTVTGSISGNNYVGGVVAYNGRSPENETSGSADTNTVYRLGVVQNCKNLAAVSGSVHCGGICGFNSGEITACTNQGKVNYLKQSSSSANFNLGGVCGYSAGKITDCTNVAEVNGGSEVLYAGGICGLSTGETYFCFNSAPVSARRYAGGIVGYFGTINSENDRNDIFGGLSIEEIYNRYFGDDTSFEEAQGEANIITYCKNTGAVTSVSYAGGVLGYSDAAVKISACISEGEVAVTAGSYAGGIAAYFTGATALIQSCYSYGNVSAKGLNGGKYAGGIVGYGNNVSSSFSVCRISGEDYLGGIAGYNQSGLTCCWANVIIIGGGDNVGNIAGFTDALNNAADSFGTGFSYNYYIENEADPCGGVGRRSYGKNYDFAACDIDGADLAFGGTVSPYLAKEFNDGGNWQGTDGVAYPVPVSFFEAEECEEYGDDTAFAKLFESHSKEFSESALNGAKVLCTISFLEWNEDNGRLYADGELQLADFELIALIR
ncbi:MAG: hypothetical protein K2O67_05645, partial [Clostridia bacterium]|nr:hypothetical protein [Clostridia bacterium]